MAPVTRACAAAAALVLLVAAACARTAGAGIAIAITAPTPQQSLWFGSSISVSGNGNAMAVAAYGYNGAVGIAYYYTLSNAGASLAATCQNTDTPTANDAFGNTVGLSDDGTVLAVGSQKQVQSFAHAGRAYVFAVGSSCTLTATLEAPSPATNDAFTIVAISGDAEYIAVGAYQTVVSGVQAGAAYVYSGRGTWAFQARLVPTTSLSPGDNFGQRVAVSHDGTYIAVTALYRATSGVVYVFRRTGTAWSQVAYLPADSFIPAGDASPTMLFGTALSFTPDASYLAIGTLQAQAVYILARNASDAWNLEQTVRPSVPCSRWGNAVKLSGDGLLLVVGCEQFGQSAPGVVFMYSRQPGGVFSESTAAGSPISCPDCPTATFNYRFGTHVSMSRNGYRVGVAAYAKDGTYAGEGEAYMWNNPLPTPAATPSVSMSPTTTNTGTPTGTATVTFSGSTTATGAPTPSFTASPSASLTPTPSWTQTAATTASITPSLAATSSPTLTQTSTLTVTVSATTTPTSSPTVTPTMSPTATLSVTPLAWLASPPAVVLPHTMVGLLAWWNADTLAVGTHTGPFTWPNALADTLPATRTSGTTVVAQEGAPIPRKFVTFSGANGDALVVADVGLGTRGTSYSVVYIGRIDDATAAGRLLASSTNDWALGYNGGVANVEASCSAGVTSGATAPQAGVWELYAEVYDSSVTPRVATLYRNGVAVGNTSGGCGPSDLSFGGGMGQYSAGSVAEVMLFTTPLARNQRRQAEGYLALKYDSLQGSLPLDHPYRYVQGSSRIQPSVLPQAPSGSIMTAVWAALGSLVALLVLGHGWLTSFAQGAFYCLAEARRRRVSEDRAKHPLASALHDAYSLRPPGMLAHTKEGARMLAVTARLEAGLHKLDSRIDFGFMGPEQNKRMADIIIQQFRRNEGYPAPCCCSLRLAYGPVYTFLETHVDTVVAGAGPTLCRLVARELGLSTHHTDAAPPVDAATAVVVNATAGSPPVGGEASGGPHKGTASRIAPLQAYANPRARGAGAGGAGVSARNPSADASDDPGDGGR